MVERMAYFRVARTELPPASSDFLSRRLTPGAPVVVVDDRSRWPVVTVGGRHVFQIGAQGGLDPDQYLGRPHTPRPDGSAPEAEWGAQPGLAAAVERRCRLLVSSFVLADPWRRHAWSPLGVGRALEALSAGPWRPCRPRAS